MDTIELSGLERQIDQLIEALKTAKAKNTQLQHLLQQDTKRQQSVDAKNHLAAEKIKKIVKQLREAMS